MITNQFGYESSEDSDVPGCSAQIVVNQFGLESSEDSDVPGCSAQVFMNQFGFESSEGSDLPGCSTNTDKTAKQHEKPIQRLAEQRKQSVRKRSMLKTTGSSSSSMENSLDEDEEWRPGRSRVKVRRIVREHRAKMAPEKKSATKRKDADHKRVARAAETNGTRERRLNQMHDYDARRRSKQLTFDALNVVEADEFTVNDMNKRCRYCGALFFEGEWVKNNAPDVFNACCLKGRLVLQNAFEGFPPKLQRLFERNYGKGFDRNFHDCIRNYNSAFAVGSMKAQTAEFKNFGPYCYKIHGQIYHTVNLAMHPEDHDPPSFAQLFIVDTAEATEHRMDFPANKDCNPLLMAELDGILRLVNPYYESFMMLKEVEEEQIREAERLGREPPKLRLLFDVKRENDRHRYNMPRANEVASVFVVDENGELPANEGISVHQKGKQLKRISKFDRRCDSMLYPLFFPTGKGGWHVNMLIDEGKKVTMEQYFRYLL